jgi:hypothetical protein
MRNAMKVAELRSQLQATHPCDGKRAGAMAACLSQDWAAVIRFEAGEATQQDKTKYGKY